jgi:hypothetical protein
VKFLRSCGNKKTAKAPPCGSMKYKHFKYKNYETFAVQVHDMKISTAWMLRELARYAGFTFPKNGRVKILLKICEWGRGGRQFAKSLCCPCR